MMLLEPELMCLMKIWVGFQCASVVQTYSKIELHLNSVFLKMLLTFDQSGSCKDVHLDTNIPALLIPYSHSEENVVVNSTS